jgi:hypothetical protein
MTAALPFPKTESSEISWRILAVIVLCGAILASGFFFAARQHFSSMELGMKNSQLRKQLSDLEAENRRLSLAREVASSPMAIQKASRLMTAPRPAAVLPADIASLKTTPPKPLTPDTEVRASLTRADVDKKNGESKVVKVAMVKPAIKAEAVRKPKKTDSRPPQRAL